MPELRTPREAWIAEGLSALGVGGPEAVRVEKLARALGVTKGGFYGYFTDRGTLLEEMLDAWESVVVDQAIGLLDAEEGDGRAKLRRLFDAARSIPEMLAVELAIREWARRDPAVGERLTRVDNRRMAYMRTLFASFCADPDEVEARCLLAAALFVGDGLFAAEHDDQSRQQVVQRALAYLLV
jgi:AcrR family transcriptional regulator